ncbi:hypothetical protein UC317_1751 [Lactococcus lactis subsp. lactis]|uniref:hypothetical protein n=1 Tax=Lactococcus lactis TaxID=1358 RepID=UPI00071D8EC4|nr:hypothetical protein [Lactococcus lactis]ARE10247.1 hypothetical protein LLUC063_0429 [Lactococcus lactis subsp. lactis]KSU32237.1 hypothetical protein UC317_1751 [Lactococcus lactis subsp. lactis]MCT0080287.1 hypothetical protein [Lactococcus lactis subsp. lactis]URL09278.1 hypothetical protein L1704_02475 [Lactococcus lactis subsp. lactis]
MFFYILFNLAGMLCFILESIDWSIFWTAAGAIATFIAALIAVQAIKQTNKQTENSNKQALFDKRVVSYFAVSQITEIYKNVQLDLEKLKNEPDKEKLAFNRPIFFKLLSLISENEIMIELWKKNIDKEDPSVEYQIALSDKIKSLRSLSLTIPLIFNNSDVKLLKQFIDCYASLFELIWKVQTLSNMDKYARKNGSPSEYNWKTFDINEELDKLEQTINDIDGLFKKIVSNGSLDNIYQEISPLK